MHDNFCYRAFFIKDDMRFIYGFLFLIALSVYAVEVIIMDYDDINYDEINVYDLNRENQDPCEYYDERFYYR